MAENDDVLRSPLITGQAGPLQSTVDHLKVPGKARAVDTPQFIHPVVPDGSNAVGVRHAKSESNTQQDDRWDLQLSIWSKSSS
jgi:hypothetical protein